MCVCQAEVTWSFVMLNIVSAWLRGLDISQTSGPGDASSGTHCVWMRCDTKQQCVLIPIGELTWDHAYRWTQAREVFKDGTNILGDAAFVKPPHFPGWLPFFITASLLGPYSVSTDLKVYCFQPQPTFLWRFQVIQVMIVLLDTWKAAGVLVFSWRRLVCHPRSYFKLLPPRNLELKKPLWWEMKRLHETTRSPFDCNYTPRKEQCYFLK